MNPLAKHPVLQFLPRDIKKQPTYDKIDEWLKMKIETFKIFRMITIIVLILFVIRYLMANDLKTIIEAFYTLNDFFAVVIPLSLLSLAIIFKNIIKKCQLGEQEIKEELEKYNKYAEEVTK